MTANVHTTMYIDTYISYDIESTVVRADQHAPRSNELRAQTFPRSFLSYINTKQHKSLLQHVHKHLCTRVHAPSLESHLPGLILYQVMGPTRKFQQPREKNNPAHATKRLQ